MRAGLSTIQQTLTPEAATALNHSIAEAGRRNHGQTTPLHVAATLLATPSGFLREACIRSHPNSTHPLQCRALELCFGVALDRLPTAPNAAKPAAEPPINNALMAALKRAQANQRRGCPEQQQQPLLAVKVELEQLILSILDDPSVSRVMREASFSSPAVKASIEESLTTSNPQTHHQPPQVGSFGTSFGGILPRISTFPSQLPTPLVHNPSPPTPAVNRNVYLNPRLQPDQRGEDVKKVMEIMARSKKRNPILVGDTELESVVKELLIQTQNKEGLRNIQIISLEKGYFSDKNQIPSKIKELASLIESKIGSGGVILDLGDLKWLVEQPVSFAVAQQQKAVSETGRAAVIEMGSLLARFGGGGGGGGGGGAADNKLWLIGTATCETYLRCQVYHSTMENDWDLQAVPITSRSPLPGLVPRLGTERSLGNQVASLAPLKIGATPPQSLTPVESGAVDSAQPMAFCPECTKKYETELLKLTAIERSFSESKQEERTSSLPQWLQNAKSAEHPKGKKLGLVTEQKLQELQKKWKDACLHLHPSFHKNHGSVKPNGPILSMPNLLNPNLLSRAPFQPKLLAKKPLGESLQLNLNQVSSQQHAERALTPPTSPVQTDLVLGREGTDKTLEKPAENQAKDFLGCISSEPQTKFLDKFANALDVDTYKKLLKGLMEKAWWQAEAASAVASAITRCRLGNGKHRGGGSRGDVWLLFMGPDRVAKKKMASVLAQQICGAGLVTISLGSRRDGETEKTDFQFRGKTAIDRIAEAIRRNPVTVIVLEDIDEADILVRGNIKRAIEQGRLTDSHYREVGLGNTVFVLTGDWSSMTTPKSLENGHFVDDKRLPSDWRLGLILREKSSKRRAPWLHGEGRRLNPREKMGLGLSLDLNLEAVDSEEEDINSSSLTIEFEDDLNLVNTNFSIASVPHELVNNVDDSILFKPADLAFVRREIKKTISVKFAMVMEDKLSIEVEDDVVERILGGLWHDDQMSLEAWIGEVVAPGFEQLKTQLTLGDSNRSVARLVVESNGGSQEKGLGNGNWLPRSIIVQGL